jgi:hypothetical protein
MKETKKGLRLTSQLKIQGIRLWLAVIFAAALAVQAQAQKADPNDPQNVERGAQMIRAAIEARGGARYLAFKTLVGTGQYTAFDKGISTIPVAFLDMIVYPDKERTEFGKGKKKDRRIQVNTGATGWVYDGDAQTLKDQSEQQARDFLENMEVDLDHLLRGGWQAEGVETRFFGREETRPGERADVVAIKLKSGRTVYLALNGYTRLPMTLSYEQTEEKGMSKYEVRFFQYVVYDGVKFPNIVDFYRDGVQVSRVNYESVKLDTPISDSLFAKPASAKEIK